MQTQQGSREEVLAAFAPAALHLCNELEAAGAFIADRSTLLVSHRELGAEIMRMFSAVNLPIQWRDS
eukprot:1247908-Pyramimonas_sp.AAC.1